MLVDVISRGWCVVLLGGVLSIGVLTAPAAAEPEDVWTCTFSATPQGLHIDPDPPHRFTWGGFAGCELINADGRRGTSGMWRSKGTWDPCDPACDLGGRFEGSGKVTHDFTDDDSRAPAVRVSDYSIAYAVSRPLEMPAVMEIGAAQVAGDAATAGTGQAFVTLDNCITDLPICYGGNPGDGQIFGGFELRL